MKYDTIHTQYMIPDVFRYTQVNMYPFSHNLHQIDALRET